MKPIFSTSDETNRIVSLFSEMSIGDTLSFSRASTILGFAFKSTSSSYQSAKRIALRDNGVVIEGIRGVGFKRLDGSEMVRKGFRTQASIRKAARRGARVAAVAIRQNLEKSDMIDATQQISRFGIIATTALQKPAKTNTRKPEKPEEAETFDVRRALKGLGERAA